MSTPTRLLEADRRDQGEHLVTITPTGHTAENWANGLIYALGKDPALLARVVSAAVNPTHETGAARSDTVVRLARILARVTEVELSTDEADVLADDIHDAMVTLPECDTEDCTNPEFTQGLCWAHYRAQQLIVAETVAKAPAYAYTGGSECHTCGEDRCACHFGGSAS